MPNQRGGSPQSQDNPTTPPIGKNYILAIANDAYPAPLYNCILDADTFVKILVEKYQFEQENVVFFHDIKRKEILKAFRALVTKVKPEDNVIIYYSGHGAYDEELDEGSWVPAGASFEDSDQFISNADLRTRLNAIKSKHTFIIIDACYSGALFLKTQRGNSNYLENFPSRWGLASGRIQTVSDGERGQHSPFAQALFNHLNNNIGALSVMDLCHRVIQQVGANTEGQMPIGEPLQVKGHQGGQFIFHPKAVSAQPTIQKDTAVAKNTPTKSANQTKKETTPITPSTTFDKTRAAKLIVEGQFEKAIKLVEEYLEQTPDTDIATSLTIIAADYKSFKRDKMMQVISYQEEVLRNNQLNARLLGLFEMLSK